MKRDRIHEAALKVANQLIQKPCTKPRPCADCDWAAAKIARAIRAERRRALEEAAKVAGDVCTHGGLASSCHTGIEEAIRDLKK